MFCTDAGKGAFARYAIACAGLLGFALGTTAAARTPVDQARPVAFASVPHAVTVGRARLLGPMLAKRHLKLAIALPLRNTDQLHALLRELYDPGSPLYHQFLSADEFTRRFAPSQSDYDAVLRWAKSHGLQVTATTKNRHLVDVIGSVRNIQSALHLHMGLYQHPTQNRTFFAPDRDPRVDLAVPLRRITGLTDFTRPRPRLEKGSKAQASAATARAGGSGANGQFLPSDMRAAYYGAGPLTGAGQTVAILSFNGYLESDLQLYFDRTGMSSSVPVNNVLVGGYSGACVDVQTGQPPCSDGESILDIANVIGMAPGVNQILFYEGLSGPDILNRIATDNIAKIISCSWGSSDLDRSNDPIFQQFLAQGQTFVSASGDSGAYGADSWMYPSLNPLILQVGGTSLSTNGPGGTWLAEGSWSQSGGGFYSPAGWAIPSYQQLPGVVTTLNGGSTAYRNDPDVAAEGDFDNPTVSNGQYLEGYGGTSFAAPRWAGFIALANQQSVANGLGPLGFVNSSLYQLGVGSAYGQNFHDVSSGNNGGFAAVAGYDLVTGWGSPNAELIGSLSGSTTAPGFVLAAYPQMFSVQRGASMGTAITVHAINGFSSSVGLSTSGLPSGVSASFSPASTATGSVLTLAASASATTGYRNVDISGAAGGASNSTPIRLFVGDAPAAEVAGGVSFERMVPRGVRSEALSIGNGPASVALDYSAAAHASSDGSCSGVVDWLTLDGASGALDAASRADISVTADPAAAALAPGDYPAEICIQTNDPAQPQIVVPVALNVVQGPVADSIFHSGFESGETQDSGVVTFALDLPVEDTQAGSALDLATGDYHTWSEAVVDNINLYNNGGAGLSVYWYNDVLKPFRFRSQVGGAVDGNGDYRVLHSGDQVGPASSFSSSAASMPNWAGGADGYIGIAFVNSLTQQLNYGYIHVSTSASSGFPAQVLDYGFDNTGAAITIP